MKLCKNVKVFGINRIVFNKTTVYELGLLDSAYHGMWQRIKSPRNKKTNIGMIDHQQMAKNITAICNTKEYDVDICLDGTVYVTTHIQKEIQKRRPTATINEMSPIIIMHM